jgi:hypothetical protein
MRLFEGLSKSDYQDVLRAIGLLLDEQGYRNFRLVENEDGIIVQATPTVAGHTAPSYHTFLLTDADLTALLHRSYERRGHRPVAPRTHVA